ncbi:M20/M25/M40 family metallo-hydrolase, partial [Chloroflexota bacterium]
PPSDLFVTLANRALESVSGEQRPLTGYVQTSDGRWFAKDGIPIIIFGPSEPAVAHAADEHVSIDQLVEATRFLTLLVMRRLGISDQKGAEYGTV